MSYRTSHGLAGVLAAAALGVLAFASSAQAIPLQSGFFIGGAQVGALLAKLSANITSPAGTLLIPGLKLEINCKQFSVVKAAIESTTLAEGQLLFEECTVSTNEKGLEGKIILEAAFGCEIIVNHTGDNRHHITMAGKTLPAELIDGKPAVLLEGTGVVLIAEGKGCLLPKTTVVKGQVCFVVLKNHTVEPEFESNETIQKSCRPRTAIESTEEKTAAEGGIKDKLLFGITETFFDSKAALFGTEVHAGKTLGVLLI